MCADPVSLTFMAVSAGVSAAGAMSSAGASARAHQSNAALFAAQAALRMEKAKYDAEQSERRWRKNEGQVVSRAASTGIDPRSFSDILNDDAQEAALERAAILWSGKNESNFLLYQAQGQEQQAADAKTAGYFNAAAGVVNSFTPAFRARLNSGGSGTGIDYESIFASTAKRPAVEAGYFGHN